MSDLWDYFNNKSVLKDKFKEYREELNYNDENNDNLEEFLSKLIIYINNANNINNIDKEAINLKRNLENELKEKCFIEYNDNSEFQYFLHYITKIRGQSNKSRLKIFTLNYDTLFEQTASKYLYTIIDGFSFTSPRRFASSNFDLDIIEKKDNRLENNSMHSRVFHLYKMHGSLNWNKKEDIIKITTPESIADLKNEDQGMIIYP